MLSFELVSQQVELARRLSASSEGMSATAKTHSGIRITTVQGLRRITYRAGKFLQLFELLFFSDSKIKLTTPLIVPTGILLKKYILKNSCDTA